MLRQTCGRCGSRVYFDNWSCLSCGARLALRPDLQHVAALEPAGDGAWLDVTDAADARYRLCGNAVDHAVCNGMLRESDPGVLCRACGFTQQIPSLSTPGHAEYWRRLERAKRRLLFTLADLGLPLASKHDAPDGLGFAFGADVAPGHRFMTSHSDGVISINIAEADDVERERIRTSMGEPYRTLLGHFRHESGHYYLARFCTDATAAGRIMEAFGDVHAGYDEALAAYYADSARTGWNDRYISAYATSHPQEDWAETWAHYLLIVDTLQSARESGVQPLPAVDPAVLPGAAADDAFEAVLARWLPLAEFANELARSLGTADAYPFVLTGPVADKMRLIDRLVRAHAEPPREAGMSIAAADGPCHVTGSIVN